jgi:hypothetical protein
MTKIDSTNNSTGSDPLEPAGSSSSNASSSASSSAPQPTSRQPRPSGLPERPAAPASNRTPKQLWNTVKGKITSSLGKGPSLQRTADTTGKADLGILSAGTGTSAMTEGNSMATPVAAGGDTNPDIIHMDDVNDGLGAIWLADATATGAQTALTAKNASAAKKAHKDHPYLDLKGVEADIAYRRTKGDLLRRIPGTQRDTVDGIANWGIKVAKMVQTVPSAAGSVFSYLGAACYLAQGASGHVKAEKSYGRALAVKDAMLTENTQKSLSITQSLIDLHDEGALSDTTCAILLRKPADDVQKFLDKFNKLSPADRENFQKKLHFSGFAKTKALASRAFKKDAGLTGDSQRWAIREAMVDSFINEVNVAPAGNRPTDFTPMENAGNLAAGAKVARQTEKKGTPYPDSIERGVSRLDDAARGQFAARFRHLKPAQIEELNNIFSFTAAPIRKDRSSDGVSNNSDAFRSGIRTELAKLFAQGYSIDKLKDLKHAYNCRAIGMSASDAEVDDTGSSANLLKQHIAGYQDLHTASTREEIRHSNIQMAYGSTQAAAAAAGSALPVIGTIAGGIAGAITAAPVYYPYSISRTLASNKLSTHSSAIQGNMKSCADQLRMEKTRHLIQENGGPDQAFQKLFDRLGSTPPSREDLHLIGEITTAYYHSLSSSETEKSTSGNPGVEEITLLQNSLEARNPVAVGQLRLMYDACMQEAKSNPYVATRWLADDLHAPEGSPIRQSALKFLRDCKFGEWEIEDLCKLDHGAACGHFDRILYGDNLRRRFSDVDLNQKGRDKASAIVDSMISSAAVDLKLNRNQPAQKADRDLNAWKIAFEKNSIRAIGNVGAPGEDSMVRSLVQSFSGGSMSTTETEQKVAAALMELHKDPAYQNPGLSSDTKNTLLIRAVGRLFGNPSPSVKLVSIDQGRLHQRDDLSGTRGGPYDAVLFKDPENRTHVLHKPSGFKPLEDDDFKINPAYDSPLKWNNCPLYEELDQPEHEGHANFKDNPLYKGLNRSKTEQAPQESDDEDEDSIENDMSYEPEWQYSNAYDEPNRNQQAGARDKGKGKAS